MIGVTHLAKAVDRASHKMKAFVRFRELAADDCVRYVARFAPEHDVLMRTAPFFVDRFAAMDWMIVTPDGIAHWDRATLRHLAPDPTMPVPGTDAAESLWLAYYESIFNPARLNVPMMRKEMPVAYWKHLPEAARIPVLIADAMPRAGRMVEHTSPCAGGNIAARAPLPRAPSSYGRRAKGFGAGSRKGAARRGRRGEAKSTSPTPPGERTFPSPTPARGRNSPARPP